MTSVEFASLLSGAHAPVGVPRLQWWEPRTLLVAADGACHECGHPIDEASLQPAWLLSPQVGGPMSRENLLALCSDCARLLRPVDWLRETRARSDDVRQHLRNRRLEVLETANNHLLRWPTQGRKMASVRRHLAQRWEQERCVIYASQEGLLGWPREMPPSDIVQVKVRTSLPKVAALGGVKVFQTTGVEDLWSLIDLGAWVRSVDPEPVIVPGPGEWPITFTTVGDIHRRRPRETRPPRYPQDRMLDALQSKFKSGRPVDFKRLDDQVAADLAWQRKAATSLQRLDDES